MLTLNPSSLRVAPGDIVSNPGGAGAASGSPWADPAGFASLLRQTQTQVAPTPMPPPPPVAAPKPPAEPEATTEPVASKEAADEAPATNESEATQRARMLLKGRLRAADGTTAPARDIRPTLDPRDAHARTATEAGAQVDEAEKAPKTDTPATSDCKASEAQLTGGTAPTDPNPAQWLAGLQRAAAGQPTDAKPATDDKAAATDAGTDTGALEARSAAKGARTTDLRADAASTAKAPGTEAAGANPFVAALAEQRASVEKPQPKAIDGVKDLSAAGAAAVAPGPTGGNDAAAPVAVPIAAPVNAPDFAQELGLRLSTLAKDGVQTAELHLNPADMGPVSVQIVMDGTQARIDFGADLAATRHAIEAGLPELAGALADAGFTLAGGGVSQHAGGRSGGGNGSGASNGDEARRITTDEQVQRVATAARRIVTQGGIDLFA